MISMKSKLTHALGFAIVAVMCGCGDDKSSTAAAVSTQIYEYEISQSNLPNIRFKSTSLDRVRLFHKHTGYGGVAHDVKVWGPNGTIYLVLDGRITITPVKNDA